MPSSPELAPGAWPEASRDRDLYVLARRPPRPVHDPDRPHGVHVEIERTASGESASVATIFLVGRECPWRCAMCDLWKYTIDEDTTPGALPRQLDRALEILNPTGAGRPAPSRVKLYNAGSFFDPRAVPVGDYDAIAARLRSFDHVVVESHPALVGERVDRWLQALAGSRAAPSPAAALEVAMGLETAQPEALARLHKGMTLEQFAQAAQALRQRGVAVRAFILAPPPFVAEEEELPWLRRSIDFAFESGVSVISIVPTRTGNGALEALARQGLFRSPRLADLEDCLAAALPETRGRVFADLWDLERLSECAQCLPARRARLERMNLEQASQTPEPCGHCGGGTPA